MEKKITLDDKATATKKEYEDVMAKIARLLTAGNGTINKKDLPEYGRLAIVAQAYEQSLYSI